MSFFPFEFSSEEYEEEDWEKEDEKFLQEQVAKRMKDLALQNKKKNYEKEFIIDVLQKNNIDFIIKGGFAAYLHINDNNDIEKCSDAEIETLNSACWIDDIDVVIRDSDKDKTFEVIKKENNDCKCLNDEVEENENVYSYSFNFNKVGNDIINNKMHKFDVMFLREDEYNNIDIKSKIINGVKVASIKFLCHQLNKYQTDESQQNKFLRRMERKVRLKCDANEPSRDIGAH